MVKRQAYSPFSIFSFLAIACILVLSFFSMMPTNQAFAQGTVSKITPGYELNIQTVGYSNGLIWSSSNNGTLGTTGKTWIHAVNATTGDLVGIFDVTREAGAIATDMWCSPDYCYISDIDTSDSGGISQIETSNSTGQIGTIVGSVDFPSHQVTHLTGRYIPSAATTRLFYVADGTSSADIKTGTISGDLATSPSSVDLLTSGSTDTLQNVYFKIHAPTDLWVFISELDAGGGGDIEVVDLASASSECSVDMSALNRAPVFFPRLSGSDGTNSHGGWNTLYDEAIFAGRDSGSIDILEDVCGTLEIDNTFSTDITGLASVQLRAGAIIQDKNILVVQESGASARISVMGYDSRSTTDAGDRIKQNIAVYNTNPADSQPLTYDNMVAYSVDHQELYFAETGSGRSIIVVDVADIQLPDTGEPEADEVPATGANEVALPDVGTSTVGAIKIWGFTEQQSKLFAAAILHLIFIGALISLSLKESTKMPLFVWGIVMVFAGAVSYILGWMDGVIFFTEIVMIVGAFAFIMTRGTTGGGGGE